MFAKITAVICFILEIYADCFLGCLRCDMYNVACIYCDTTLNYTLYEGTCALTLFPNCDQYSIDGMCIACQAGYYVDPVTNACVQVPSGSIDKNCKYYDSTLSCILCQQDYYLTDTGCTVVPQKAKGCLVYVKDNPLLCSICETSYYLSSDQTNCFPKPNNATCMWYSNIVCTSCLPGYVLDYNYYITALFDETSWIATENFMLWTNNRISLLVPQCRPTVIVNCTVFTNYKTCSKCTPGYILSASFNCVQMPTSGIANCLIYKDLNTCTNCTIGFYLTNPTTCSPVVPKSNCATYLNYIPTTTCNLCLSNYYLDNELTCQPRTNMFKNCEAYTVNADNCAVCNSALGLQVTGDGLGCLPQIVNCNLYDVSTITSNFLTCSACITGYTYIVATKVCQLGKVANCYTYDKNNVCNLCLNGYYLTQGQCYTQAMMPNCLVYSATTNNSCLTCVANSYRFEMANFCFVFNVILFCAQYYDQNSCYKCHDYYYMINSRTCIAINLNLNCIQFSGQSCMECKPGYFLNNGLCQLPTDYQTRYCGILNIDGTISSSQFLCGSCNTGAIPLNMKNYYLCTNPQGASWLTANCLKYSYNKQGRIVCDRCAAGLYVYSGTCVQTCPVGTILYLAQAQGFNKLGQSGNNNFTITGINVCDVSPLADTNCIAVTPGAVQKFNPNLGSLTNSYVCAKCAPGTIKVIGDYSGVSFGGFDVSPIPPGQTNTHQMTEIIDLYPGFTCVVPNNKIQSDFNTFVNSIANCEYYYRPSSNIYCCIKCNHGYSGRVFASPNIDSQIGCLLSCNLIPYCDRTTIYKGLWQSISMINFSRSLLDTYFSCHKCATGYVPLTIINFTSHTGFKQRTTPGGQPAGLEILIPAPSIFSTMVRPNWTEQINILKDKCSCANDQACNGPNTCAQIVPRGALTQISFCATRLLQEYLWTTNSFSGDRNCDFFDTNTLITLITYPNTFYGTAADTNNNMNYRSDNMMNQCIEPRVSSFAYLVGNQFPNVMNCAMYLGNAMQYPTYWNADDVNNDLLSNISIYCAACLPGYAIVPFYATNMLPYLIKDCLPISNCASGSTWANFCSRCSNGFIYQYDATYLHIDFTVCQPYTKDPNCYAVSSLNINKCAICKVGYTFNPDSVCDRITIPFCSDLETFAPTYIQFHSVDRMYLGPMLYYFYPSMSSCNQCQQNYVALKMLSDTLICVPTTYIQAKVYVANSVFKTDKCRNFNMDASGNYNCYTCVDPYIAASNGNCYLISTPEHNNCLWAYNEASCDVCLFGYVFVNKICMRENINLCLTYHMDKSLQTQVCIECAQGYYSSNGGSVCFQGTIENCLEYVSISECSACKSGYQLLSLANLVSYCIPIPTELKCLKYDYNFQAAKMYCEKCLSGYVATSNGIFPTDYCVPFRSVPNCVAYNIGTTIATSSFVCKMCSVNYYLSTANFNCLPRTTIDPNCLYLLRTQDACILCTPGYYIDADKKTCKTNPIGIIGCSEYLDHKNCINCANGFYLSKNACVSIGDSAVPNCQRYSGPSKCTSCAAGFYLLANATCSPSVALNCYANMNYTACASCPALSGFQTLNGITSCIPFTDLNCMKSNMSFPFKCQLCYTLFYPDINGVCQSVKTIVLGCIYYSSDGVCSQCNPTTILSIDNKTCVADAYSLSFTDPNCAANIFVSAPTCLACRLGFYFDSDRTCQSCGNNCGICDPINSKSCILCLSGFYMDYNGKCIANSLASSAKPTSSSNSTSTKTVSGLSGLLTFAISEQTSEYKIQIHADQNN